MVEASDAGDNGVDGGLAKRISASLIDVDAHRGTWGAMEWLTRLCTFHHAASPYSASQVLQPTRSRKA